MNPRRVLRTGGLLALLLIAQIVLTACGSTGAAPGGSGGDKVKIGFIYVGPTDDYGYNYAADQGRLYLQKQLGEKVETVSAENVPEDANAERVMEQMINSGATIIFPTSYGHFNPAVNESKKHPTVDFWHQGGLAPSQNVGSYFGEIWQMVYASGVAAGKMTKSNKLGYISALKMVKMQGGVFGSVADSGKLIAALSS
jgi:basic membrane protein A